MKQHIIRRHIVPRETFNYIDEILLSKQDQLKLYLEQLLWWNKRINLVSRDVPRETIWQHIRHSMLLIELDFFQENDLIVDSGTGGGLPGLPLAICSDNKQFILNDKAMKKSLALKQMVRKIGLGNVKIDHNSILELELNIPFLLVSKHAFKITRLLEFTKKKPWTSMVFYKGAGFKAELKRVRIPLHVHIYDLYEGSGEQFYKGKFIIQINVER